MKTKTTFFDYLGQVIALLILAVPFVLAAMIDGTGFFN